MSLQEQLDFRRILSRIKEFLSKGGYAMSLLSEFIIISEMWSEDSRVNIIAWIPDMSPEKGLVYVKKKIIYDVKNDQLIEIKELKE
ncbi:MAG: hypothetical protein ABWW65_04100 [Thermoprotei archaeon]